MKYKETKIGIVPEHWEVLPIKNITEVVTDYVANGSFASLAENVTYKDEEDVAVLIRLVDYNNNFQGKFVFIDEHAYEFLGKSKLFGDEIIISNVGANVGTVFRCPKLQYKMSLAPNSIMVKFKGNDDFYFHWLRGYNGQQMLKSIVTGSAQPKFNKTNFKEMLAPVPPIEEQNKIAFILNSLDEKIELNNAINNNLLEQAENIFNKYYDAAINQQPFTSIISVLGGGTPKTSNSDFWNGEIPFFTPKDVGSPYTFQTEKYITVDGLGHCNSRLYPINTSFVTARGTVGKVSLAGVPMAMNQSCYALASDTIDPILVYFYTLRAVDSLKHKASGAVFDAIVTRDFNTELINVLSETDLNTVLELVSPMLEIVHNNSAENLRLAVLRDALLPQLMSGELDVSDIDL